MTENGAGEMAEGYGEGYEEGWVEGHVENMSQRENEESGESGGVELPVADGVNFRRVVVLNVKDEHLQEVFLYLSMGWDGQEDLADFIDRIIREGDES